MFARYLSFNIPLTSYNVINWQKFTHFRHHHALPENDVNVASINFFEYALQTYIWNTHCNWSLSRTVPLMTANSWSWSFIQSFSSSGKFIASSINFRIYKQKFASLLVNNRILDCRNANTVAQHIYNITIYVCLCGGSWHVEFPVHPNASASNFSSKVNPATSRDSATATQSDSTLLNCLVRSINFSAEVVKFFLNRYGGRLV